MLLGFKKQVYYLLVVLWLVLMLYLSHQNGSDTWNTSHGLTVYLSNLLGLDAQWLHGVIRKLAHVGLYLILELLIVLAAVKSGAKKPWLWALLPLAVSLLDEGTKPLIPGRHCDLEDILLNDVGAAIGWIFLWCIARKYVDKQ